MPLSTSHPAHQYTKSGPIVLSFGLGCDSSAILTRWLTDPGSRDFELSDLVVLTAMVGDEYPDSLELVSEHLLPLMAAHRVRYVQLARGGLKQADGIVVLDDSREPGVLHGDGVYRLSDELRNAGTIPQVAEGRRTCSQKFKGWVNDSWLRAEFGDRPFTHVFGFNADEQRRADRDVSYVDNDTLNRSYRYPLIEWGWGRDRLEEFLQQTWGRPWAASACAQCCFASCAGPASEIRERWRRFPQSAADALYIEHVALALNPNTPLFGRRSAHALVTEDGNTAALDALAEQLAAQPWAVYEVRRIFFARKGDPQRKGTSWRSVRKLATGTPEQMHAELARRATGAGIDVVEEAGSPRAWLARRGAGFPTWEHMLVLAPATAADKERPTFADRWAELVDVPQLELFAG